MTGRKKRYKGTRTYECREVKIHTDAPLPVHVDGEVCGNVNDIQAECIPRKVRMMF
jgi:diacylglycerol kinase family enzyme